MAGNDLVLRIGIILFLIAAVSAIAFAIPNSISIQGKLTNAAGTTSFRVTGNNNIIFHLE